MSFIERSRRVVVLRRSTSTAATALAVFASELMRALAIIILAAPLVVGFVLLLRWL